MSKEPPRITVTRNGEIDHVRLGIARMTELRDASALEAQITELAKMPGRPRVVIDFQAVTFFSSAVLGVLVAGREQVLARDGVLAVCGLNAHLTEVVRVVGLDRLLPFYASSADAIQAMR